MSIFKFFKKDKTLTITSLLESTKVEMIGSEENKLTLFKQSNKHAHFVLELSLSNLSLEDLKSYIRGENAEQFTKDLKAITHKNITFTSKVEIMYIDDLPNKLTTKPSVKGKKTLKLLLESDVSDFNNKYIELRKYKIFILVTIEGYKKLKSTKDWSSIRHYFGEKEDFKTFMSEEGSFYTFCLEDVIEAILEKGYKRDIKQTLINGFQNYGANHFKSSGPLRFVSGTQESFFYDMFSVDGPNNNMTYLADTGGGSSTFAANVVTRYLLEGVNVYIADDHCDFIGLNNFFDINNITSNVSLNPFKTLQKRSGGPFFKTYANFIAILIDEKDLEKINKIEDVVRAVYKEKREETTLLSILEVLEEDWLISDKIGGYTKKKVFLNGNKAAELKEGLNLFDSSNIVGIEREAFETLFLANVMAKESTNSDKFVIVLNRYQGRLNKTAEKFYIDLSRSLAKINGALLFLSDITNETGIDIVKESRSVVVSQIYLRGTSYLEEVLDKELKNYGKGAIELLRDDIDRLNMLEDPKGNYKPNFLLFENGKRLLKGRLMLFSKFKLLLGQSAELMKRKVNEISDDGEIRTEEALLLKILKEG